MSPVTPPRHRIEEGKTRGYLNCSFEYAEHADPNGEWKPMLLHASPAKQDFVVNDRQIAKCRVRRSYAVCHTGTYLKIILRWETKTGKIPDTWMNSQTELVVELLIDGDPVPILEQSIRMQCRQNPLVFCLLHLGGTTSALRFTERANPTPCTAHKNALDVHLLSSVRVRVSECSLEDTPLKADSEPAYGFNTIENGCKHDELSHFLNLEPVMQPLANDEKPGHQEQTSKICEVHFKKPLVEWQMCYKSENLIGAHLMTQPSQPKIPKDMLPKKAVPVLTAGGRAKRTKTSNSISRAVKLQKIAMDPQPPAVASVAPHQPSNSLQPAPNTGDNDIVRKATAVAAGVDSDSESDSESTIPLADRVIARRPPSANGEGMQRNTAVQTEADLIKSAGDPFTSRHVDDSQASQVSKRDAGTTGGSTSAGIEQEHQPGIVNNLQQVLDAVHPSASAPTPGKVGSLDRDGKAAMTSPATNSATASVTGRYYEGPRSLATQSAENTLAGQLAANTPAAQPGENTSARADVPQIAETAEGHQGSAPPNPPSTATQPKDARIVQNPQGGEDSTLTVKQGRSQGLAGSANVPILVKDEEEAQVLPEVVQEGAAQIVATGGSPIPAFKASEAFKSTWAPGIKVFLQKINKDDPGNLQALLDVGCKRPETFFNDIEAMPEEVRNGVRSFIQEKMGYTDFILCMAGFKRAAIAENMQA